MLSKVFAPAVSSPDATIVEIECDVTSGLPGFIVVGLADKAVDESRERVRSAIRNSALDLPAKRLTLNLAPADLPKDGTAYDVGLAVAVMAACGLIPRGQLNDAMFMGELALDGTLRPVKGALIGAQIAANAGYTSLFVPQANADEAALANSIAVYPVNNLRELYLHLIGVSLIATRTTNNLAVGKVVTADIDLAEIRGNYVPKRALEIAAAGGHNILLIGPPGTGKTMLARAAVGLMPPLSTDEMVAVTRNYSLAGLTKNGIMMSRPFRAPHHSASVAALVGGGSQPRPGEISLSHKGVLFLDELPEFPRATLEALRQPLESGTISISRASGTVTFPADFMLIATQNPCPCGYYGDATRSCSCKPVQIANYRRKISGPLLDRIDLVVEFAPLDPEIMTSSAANESTAAVYERVTQARNVQLSRRPGDPSYLNAHLTETDIERDCKLNLALQSLATHAIQALRLSARGYSRVLRVARTIADLDGQKHITSAHFTEALQYRARMSA